MEDVYATSKLDSGYPWGEISQAEKATVKNKFLDMWREIDARWDETRLNAVIDWRLYRLHKWEREKRLRDDRKRHAKYAPNAAFDPVRDAANSTAPTQPGLTAQSSFAPPTNFMENGH